MGICYPRAVEERSDAIKKIIFEGFQAEDSYLIAKFFGDVFQTLADASSEPVVFSDINFGEIILIED